MTEQAPRPSDARREALSENLSVPVVSNFFPLDSYYGAADKVYDSFLVALENANKAKPATAQSPPDPVMDAALDDAYVYGKRYCKFCLEALPEHNYHGTPKYRQFQTKHTRQVSKVLGAIETVVVVKMDEYESIKQHLYQQEQKRIAAARKAAEEHARLQAERRQQARLEELQQRIAKQKAESLQPKKPATNGKTATTSTEASAMSKLQLLLPPSAQEPPRIQRDPSGEEPDDDQLPAMGRPSTRYAMPASSDEEDGGEHSPTASSSSALPPPLLPPPPPPSSNGSSSSAASTPPAVPPSYQQIIAARNKRYQNNLLWDPSATTQPDHFINGLRVHPSAPAAAENGDTLPPPPAYPGAPGSRPGRPQRQQKPAVKPTPPPKKKKIPLAELQKLSAQQYQRFQKAGKIRVTPLDTYQGRYSESTNGCTVISALVASAHLRSTRTGGVSDAAVCRVIDQQCGPLLRQIRSKLGLGGHALIIPSDVHDHLVDQKLLSQDAFVGVAGGNILDPEHLGAFLNLLKVGESGKLLPYPTAATLFFREHVISIVKKVSGGRVVSYDLIDSLPSLSYNGKSKASRTVCQDFESLQVLLQWYASRKFSSAQCQHVDRNAWNDSMADLDPRVFQGFVWADAPNQ